MLAVSSAHDTVHIFKLGAGGQRAGGSGAREEASPEGSVESRDDGGYDAFIDGKKKSGGGGGVS